MWSEGQKGVVIELVPSQQMSEVRNEVLQGVRRHDLPEMRRYGSNRGWQSLRQIGEHPRERNGTTRSVSRSLPFGYVRSSGFWTGSERNRTVCGDMPHELLPLSVQHDAAQLDEEL